jgi:hypothetical protein
MDFIWIIAGVSLLAVIGFIAWLWWISWSAPMGTETKHGLRIERPPLDDSRSSIATHRKIMDSRSTRV